MEQSEQKATLPSVSNRMKLKWKLFAYLIGFCTLLLVLLWMMQTVFLDAFYQHVKTIEIRKDVQSLADYVEKSTLDVDNLIGGSTSKTGVIEKSSNSVTDAGLTKLIASISDHGERYVEVGTLAGTSTITSTNTKYKVSLSDKKTMIEKAKAADGEAHQRLALAPPQIPTGPNPADNKPSNSNSSDALQQVDPGNGSVENATAKPFATVEQQTLAYLKLVQAQDGTVYTVLINAMTTPVDATVATLRYQLYLVTGVMLILATLLALLVARRIAKPIEDISRSAKVLAQGNYSTCFRGTGYLEIQELSETLNTTAVELGKVEELRRELMANVSHDLRTPLALIYSYAEMMHDFPLEITKEQTQVIMVETKRLTTLVNDVLDLSKLEAGVQQLDAAVFSLTDSVRDTVERISKLVDKDGYNLSFEAEQDALVFADEIRLNQVVYNLLINAIHYSGEDKTVTIRQTIVKNTVKIEVQDHGSGITAENLTYIWDRYYKVDKKHKRATMGSGLGLSIVKMIIEAHGGEYGVESNIGQGSTFWFRLKCHPLINQ